MSMVLSGVLQYETTNQIGDYNHTNINGNKYSGHASNIDINETLIGFASAIFAAVKEDSATGGVTIDRTPKYNTNRCAYISVIPASIRDGAATIATRR